MTIQEIEAMVASSKYDFLRNNPHLGKNIILLGLGGSHAYGTNTKDSDLDIRGITLNTKEQLLGINSNFEQFVNDDTDTTIYGLKKMVNLLCNMNPNTIEILGLEPWQYLFVHPIGKELIDNKNLFLSRKCINSFGGYANSQLYRLNQKASHEMHQEELEKHILKTLEFMSNDFGKIYSCIPGDNLNLYIDKSDREEMDTEIFMDVKLSHYPLRDYLSMWNELKNTASQYNRIGKRNNRALEKGKIGKHMMHLVRLYHMCFDILEKKEINTYRDKDHDELMEIRNGKYITEDNQVIPEFFEMVNKLEERLQYDSLNTDLPEKPNYKAIEEMVMSINERVVKEEI